MKKLLLLILALLFSPLVAQAEINGPVGCNAGTLIMLKSDRSAVWYTYPPYYRSCCEVSEDGKTLYFASTIPGKVVFMAASSCGYSLLVEQHEIYNGMNIPVRTFRCSPYWNPAISNGSY